MHLEPHAVAIMVCQGSGTRGDQVALVFGKLYSHYSGLFATDRTLHAPVEAILNSLEKRWGQVDHDFFLVSLIMNPWVHMSLFSDGFRVYEAIPMLISFYRRVFQLSEHDQSIPVFTTRIMAYLERRSDCDVFGVSGGSWTLAVLCNTFPVC